jgi:hypothetical protein
MLLIDYPAVNTNSSFTRMATTTPMAEMSELHSEAGSRAQWLYGPAANATSFVKQDSLRGTCNPISTLAGQCVPSSGSRLEQTAAAMEVHEHTADDAGDGLEDDALFAMASTKWSLKARIRFNGMNRLEGRDVTGMTGIQYTIHLQQLPVSLPASFLRSTACTVTSLSDLFSATALKR